MSRLLIPNTTQVPNVIFDEVMRQVSDPALRVLLAIVRKTYGFQKQSDHISLTQLEAITGLSRQGAVNGVKALGEIIRVRQGKRDGNEYALNLNVATGQLVNEIDQSTRCTSQREPILTSQRGRHTKPNKNKTNKSGDKSPDLFVKETVGTDQPQSQPKRRRAKPTRRDPAWLAAFEAFYQAYPRHVAPGAAEKAWLKVNPNPELVATIMAGVQRYAQSVADTEPHFIAHPASWLNAKRWEDELAGGNAKVQMGVL